MKTSKKLVKILSVLILTNSIFIPLMALASCAQEKKLPPPSSIVISGDDEIVETAAGWAWVESDKPFTTNIDSANYDDEVIWHLVDPNDGAIVPDFVGITKDGKIYLTENTSIAQTLNLQVYCTSASNQNIASQKLNLTIKIVDNNYNGCHYALINNNKEYALTKYDGNSNEVIIANEFSKPHAWNFPVTAINYQAFLDATNLTSVTISNNVMNVADYAFMNCNNLKTFKMGDKITWARTRMIVGCPNIETFVFGESVEYIEQNFFNQFPNTTSITVVPSNKVFSMATNVGTNGSVVLTDKSGKLNKDCSNVLFPTACGEITIGDDITGIIVNAFNDNLFLKSVKISDKVTSIINYAFSGCSNLTEVYFNWPKCPMNMSNNIFLNCDKLKTINLPIGADLESYKWVTEGRNIVYF